jgi:hypothetical protein
VDWVQVAQDRVLCWALVIIKDAEFLDQWRDYQLLMNVSAT